MQYSPTYHAVAMVNCVLNAYYRPVLCKHAVYGSVNRYNCRLKCYCYFKDQLSALNKYLAEQRV